MTLAVCGDGQGGSSEPAACCPLSAHHAQRNQARRGAGLALRRQLCLPQRRAARHLQVLDPRPRYPRSPPVPPPACWPSARVPRGLPAPLLHAFKQAAHAEMGYLLPAWAGVRGAVRWGAPGVGREAVVLTDGWALRHSSIGTAFDYALFLVNGM